MDLSEVRGAIAEKYNSDQAASDQAEKPEVKSDSSSEVTAESTPQTAQAILDLSKAEKFMIEGKEYTWDQLNKERLLMSDYTRKTQELAEQRRQIEEQTRYTDNLEVDLRSLKQRPELISEFKKIYPERFHAMADLILDGLTPQQAVQQGTSLDPRTIQKYVEPLVKPLQEKLDKYETEALTKQMDAVLQTMKTKYPSAEEEYAIGRLRALADQNVPITEQKIEEVFKFFHEKDTQAKEAYHREQLKKQSEANKKAKDMGAGGGTPGQAPKRLKLNEVAGALREHLSRS